MRKTYDQMKNRQYRSMRTNSIAYPYWENEARVVEDKQVKMLMLRIALLIIPCISLIWLLWHLWKHRSWSMKDLVKQLMEKMQDRWEERRRNHDSEREESEDQGDADTQEASGEEIDADQQESGDEMELCSVTSVDIFQS